MATSKKSKKDPYKLHITKEDNYDPNIIEKIKELGLTDITDISPKEIDWYRVGTLMKKYPDCTYYMIIGQRGDGKSYSVCEEMLKDYRDNQKRFAYLRRWTDDVNTFACSTLFKQELVDEIFGEDYEIKFRNHVFTLVHHQYDEETGKDNPEKFEIGYATAISEAKHRKGTNYPNVHIIFYDEFIDMAGENILANEYNKFENVVNTIKRQNKCTIIMCANTVSKYSEYFTKMGINIDQVAQGETKTYLHPNGQIKVALEYCKYNCVIGYFVGSVTNSSMIATGQWEIPPTDEIPSEANEKVEEKLLFTAYQPELNATLGVYLRYGVWTSYENIQQITTPIEHEREFLVIRRIADDKKSTYFHLTNQKSLAQTHYHRLDLMLKDILELTEIDVKRELLMGRVFCDTMFTGDIFNRIWEYYSTNKVRELL